MLENNFDPNLVSEMRIAGCKPGDIQMHQERARIKLKMFCILKI